jgi:hypothetical protein
MGLFAKNGLRLLGKKINYKKCCKLSNSCIVPLNAVNFINQVMKGKTMKQPTNLEVLGAMLLGALIGITLGLVYVYRTGGF